MINRYLKDHFHKFHSFYSTRYALEISCLAFLSIVNVSIGVLFDQNALNDLLVVIILYPLVGNAKKPEMDDPVRYFANGCQRLKSRLRYQALLHALHENEK